jgi:hypothetical protein
LFLLAEGRPANKDKEQFNCRGKGNMKSDEVKQLTTRAIEQLSTALSAGCSEELTRYLAAMSRFHRYSLHNVMLITLLIVQYALDMMNISDYIPKQTAWPVQALP